MFREPLLTSRLENLESGESLRISTTLAEIEQRAIRKNNIIITGIAECVSGTVQERTARDKEVVSRIFDRLGVSPECIKSVRRLGKVTSQKTNPRIIQLVCNTFEKKLEVLKSARALRNIDEYKGVFINVDQTKMQQYESFKLREELRRRKKAGEDVVISHGEIVQKPQTSSDFP